jgi:acyl-CoA reductase-like NAD-dependent aldehyde dehydrogenase
METHYPLSIPGVSTSDGDIEVTAPYDGAHIAAVTAADGEAVELALHNAEQLFQDRSRWLRPAQRTMILEKVAQIMAERAEQLAVDAAREGGKPLGDSRVEVARAIDSVRNCIEVLRTQSGSEIPMNLNLASEGKIAVTRHEPIGIVVAVSAFNHPLNLIVHQVGPAVATGCPVIIKPAEDTPLSCYHFVSILREAGLPAEWCQALVVKNLEYATQLVTDPRVAFFSFIGSAKVGWTLRSQLAPGTRCALEHGGVAPVIVAEDADWERALPAITKGGFYHAGQVCVSVQRVFAQEKIALPFAQQLAERASKLVVGDPTSHKTEVGPLIRHRETDRVEAWVKEAIDGGAEVLCGGKRISPSCFEPTVLLTYKDLEEAIQRANVVPFAFQAAVFTRSIDTAMRVYRHVEASSVMVNEHTAFRVDWMPFAGLKQSGLAVGGIPHTMHDMQIQKMLVLHSDELRP